MNSPTPTCNKCGQPIDQGEYRLADGPLVCAACENQNSEERSEKKSGHNNSGMLPKASSKAHRLLPTKKTGANSESQSVPASDRIASIEKLSLLPPKKTKTNDSLIRLDKNTGPDGQWVVLPDASGGFSKVANTGVRITENGQEVLLKARSRRDALRHRVAVNVVAILAGLAILFGAFWLAINGYI